MTKAVFIIVFLALVIAVAYALRKKEEAEEGLVNANNEANRRCGELERQKEEIQNELQGSRVTIAFQRKILRSYIIELEYLRGLYEDLQRKWITAITISPETELAVSGVEDFSFEEMILFYGTEEPNISLLPVLKAILEDPKVEEYENSDWPFINDIANAEITYYLSDCKYLHKTAEDIYEILQKEDDEGKAAVWLWLERLPKEIKQLVEEMIDATGKAK